MNNYSLLYFCIAVLFVSCKSNKEKANELTSAEKNGGWELLFDGQDLNHWQGFNEDIPGSWSANDGTLYSSGAGGDIGGDIVTKDKYDNFHLKLDWKISLEGNSGIFYHVIMDTSYQAPYETGPEYQLLDDVGFPSPIEEWQMTGADYAMTVANDKKKLNPVGEWNNSEVIFDNGHVEHWLNGEKIVEFEAWTDEWRKNKNSGKWDDFPDYGIGTNGYVGLQDHGSEIWFKNVKIKRLSNKERSLFNGESLSGWKIYGDEKWYVEDGLLVCESASGDDYGYLATDEYFDNFELNLKFKQESNGNSGVFFRSTIDSTRITGWQVEVAPRDHDSGGIYESYGRGWLVQIPDEKEDILKEDDWNDMKIIVNGDHVQTYLNGEQMVDLHDEKIGAAQGRIALQIHDGGGVKVLWKDIHIKLID